MYSCTVYIVSAALFAGISAQLQADSVSKSLNQFAVNFLAETVNLFDAQQLNANIALSPYTVWNVLAIVNEGARSNTAYELEKVLGIPSAGTPSRNQFAMLQRNLIQSIMKSTPGVTLNTLNAIFTRAEKKLHPYYQEAVKKLYDVDVTPLNFNDSSGSAHFINKKLYDATRGRLNNIVKEADLADAQMFVTSALFFKGLWDNKFDKADTKPQAFYDETNQAIGTVNMMFQAAPFPYSLVLDNKAIAVELPYLGKQMSMIVILPKLNVLVKTILDLLTKTPFTDIIDILRKSEEIYSTDLVNVWFPKFRITSDFNLNHILHHMGIQDVINAGSADLSNISSDNLYLSNVIQKAEIEVDEEGTVASAIAVGDLENKMPPPNFEANRPFLFFIFDKQTQSIVFTGRFSSPTSM